jgi:hypothetical protein
MMNDAIAKAFPLVMAPYEGSLAWAALFVKLSCHGFESGTALEIQSW